MSSIVLLIANAYEEFENNASNTNSNNVINNSNTNNNWRIRLNKAKNLLIANKILAIMLIILIISMITYGLSIIFNWNNIIIGCSLIIFSLDMFIMVSIVDKKTVKNYSKRKDGYYNKMENFKATILETQFHINSKNKVEQLIEECDNTCKILKEDSRIIKNPSELWKNIIVPIVTFYIGTIFNLDFISKQITLEVIVQSTMLVIMFLGMILGVYMIIKPMLATIINIDSNRIKRLRNVLNDIYLIHYI